MSRNRWRMMAGVFAVGAALGAAGVTAMGRRRQWDGDGPASTVDPPYRGGESVLGSIHDDSEPYDAGTRTPDLAVSTSVVDAEQRDDFVADRRLS